MIRIIAFLFLLSLSSNAYATNWCDDANVLGCWTIETGSGETLDDKSSNINDGTFRGSGEPAWSGTVPGASDGFWGTSTYSILGDGSNDYVSMADDIPSIAVADDFSWGTWVYALEAANTPYLGNRYGGTASPLQFAKMTTNAFEYYNAGTDPKLTPGPTNNQWVHVFVSKDGANFTYYHDGVSVDTDTTSSTMDSNPMFLVGDSGGEYANVYVDETVIFSDAKDSTDINEIMENGLSGDAYEHSVTNWCNDANCQACWLFDEGSGESIADSSANSNTGTFRGSGEPAWASMAGTNAPSYADYMVDFDGSDDVITVTGLIGTPSQATIIGWGDLDSADTSGATLFSMGDNFGIVLDKTNGTTGFYHKSGGWVNAESNDDHAGTGWHSFAYSSNPSGSSQVLYVDGVSEAVTSDGTAFDWTGQGSNTLMGRHADGATTVDFNGTTSETAFFDRILDSNEINDIMDNGLYYAAPSVGGYFMGIY